MFRTIYVTFLLILISIEHVVCEKCIEMLKVYRRGRQWTLSDDDNTSHDSLGQVS